MKADVLLSTDHIEHSLVPLLLRTTSELDFIFPSHHDSLPLFNGETKTETEQRIRNYPYQKLWPKTLLPRNIWPILKHLINSFRCVWLGLELKSAG